MLRRTVFKALLRAGMVLVVVSSLTACGGGAELTVGIDPGPPPVAPLGIALTRVGPEAIEIDWSDDPDVATFVVRRDGYALATVTTTALIDASVLLNEQYCYRVSGYDVSGALIAASATACVTLLP